MQVVLDQADLEPLVSRIVSEVAARMQVDSDRLEGRLAFSESEAANLLGVSKHVLRDARLRGEISASRVGKSTVYQRSELIAFLERQRTK
jgi:excisionase family DNA binding protein